MGVQALVKEHTSMRFMGIFCVCLFCGNACRGVSVLGLTRSWTEFATIAVTVSLNFGGENK